LSISSVVRRRFQCFGGEIVEGQQCIAILDQALDRLLVFDAPGFGEGFEGGEGILLLGLGSCSARVAFDCWLLGSLLRTLAVL
jgi:hypothetical protein